MRLRGVAKKVSGLKKERGRFRERKAAILPDGWDKYSKECTRFCNGQTVCSARSSPLSTEQRRTRRDKEVLNEVSVSGGLFLWIVAQSDKQLALPRSNEKCVAPVEAKRRCGSSKRPRKRRRGVLSSQSILSFRHRGALCLASLRLKHPLYHRIKARFFLPSRSAPDSGHGAATPSPPIAFCHCPWDLI